MDEERDILVFADEDGNEIEMDIIDVFDYNERRYALLMTIEDIEEQNDDAEPDVYIMEVVEEDGEDAFLPIDEEMMPGLEEEVYRRLQDMDMLED